MPPVPKSAVITGANRGLGFELIRQMSSSSEQWGNIYALCRHTTDRLKQLSDLHSNIVVVENIDVTKDDVGTKLQATFQSKGEWIPIDVLIHNAGAYGPPEEFVDESAMRSSQSLQNVTMDRMRGALELNTLGPLKVTQALLPNLKDTSISKEPKKIIIISSAMGSIEENGSGGSYGYRTAKAAVNMIGKSLAADLKGDNISVGMIHPGYVLTGFDNANQGDDKPEEKRNPGQRDVGPSATGVLQAIEKVTMETTGSFWHGNYGDGVKSLPW